MMMDAKILIDEYVALAEKTLVEFSYDDAAALKSLAQLKEKLSQKHSVEKNQQEMFEACTYNALAVIGSAVCQDRKNNQLIELLCEAKDEMKAIGEALTDFC